MDFHKQLITALTFYKKTDDMDTFITAIVTFPHILHFTYYAFCCFGCERLSKSASL